MTAGTGVTHSEFNHEADQDLRLLQIWILPAERGLEPGYEEANFPVADKRDRLRLIVSPDGRDGSLRIHQDVAVYASVLDEGRTLIHKLASGRHAWVQVARGTIAVNGMRTGAGRRRGGQRRGEAGDHRAQAGGVPGVRPGVTARLQAGGPSSRYASSWTPTARPDGSLRSRSDASQARAASVEHATDLPWGTVRSTGSAAPKCCSKRPR